jgi:hypothetical protein
MVIAIVLPFLLCGQASPFREIGTAPFFPMKVGNIYVYANMGGLRSNKIVSIDTIVVTHAEDHGRFTRFHMSDKSCYDLDRGIVVMEVSTMTGDRFNNILFCPVARDTVLDISDGCAIWAHVRARRLDSHRVGGIVYRNCYEYIFDSENDGYYVIAHGVGIVERVWNRKRSILLNYAIME